MRMSCFDRTGCNLTVDGSEDHKVKPEGLLGYKPYEPLETQAAPEPLVPGQANVEPEEPPEDRILPDESDEESEDEDVDEEDIILEPIVIDNEEDRLFTAKLVGKKIRALYSGEWQTGTLKYYNRKLDKYLLAFDDDSNDWISEAEIDGVETFFVDRPNRPPRRSGRVDYRSLAEGN